VRTVTYGGACSLDGFIAATDGSLDWLHYSKDVQDVMATYWATIDTVLMGRRTWEVAAASGAGGAMPDVETFVFSRTMTARPHPEVALVSEDAGGFVRDLKRRRGRGICVMGGGILAASLFEADVIDEVGLNIHPILLGSGIPALPDAGRRIALRLIGSRTLDGGCVLATYTVIRDRAAS
jgi:dihydrofolate reductase